MAEKTTSIFTRVMKGANTRTKQETWPGDMVMVDDDKEEVEFHRSWHKAATRLSIADRKHPQPISARIALLQITDFRSPTRVPKQQHHQPTPHVFLVLTK